MAPLCVLAEQICAIVKSRKYISTLNEDYFIYSLWYHNSVNPNIRLFAIFKVAMQEAAHILRLLIACEKIS